MAAEKPEQNGKQRPPPVKLSTFSVVYERGDSAPLLDDPLIHCKAGQQLVLAFVSRNALMDYFHIHDERIPLHQWNLVLERNLDAFIRIIEGKYERDEWEAYNSQGQSYPRVLVRLEDMERCGEQLTAEARDLDVRSRADKGPH